MADIFEPFPKLYRLNRDVVITEKLDGTNAQIYIVDPETREGCHYEDIVQTTPISIINDLRIYAGSRTRLVSPGKTSDNFGFASWVKEHSKELVELGEGRHYGEWYGNGIQRGYNLNHKRFALFNTSMWRSNLERGNGILSEGQKWAPNCCDVVPIIYQGPMDTYWTDRSMSNLKTFGSYAVEGYDNPEGIVVYHTASRTAFKQTFDDKHKGQA